MAKLLNVWPFTKIWGGKWYQRKILLAPIVEAALAGTPVDGFFDAFGGGGVLTQNASFVPCRIYNDDDWFKYNFFQCVQEDAAGLQSALEAIPYEESQFRTAKEIYRQADASITRDPDVVDSFDKRKRMELAVVWFVQSRMSRAGLGEDFGIGTRTRGGKPGDINAYENVVAAITETAAFWKGVYLWHSHFRTAIPRIMNHGVLRGKRLYKYYDPPYLPSKRVTPKAYRREMTREEHEEMAHLIMEDARRNPQSLIAVSGYNSEEYDTWFRGFEKIRFEIDSKVGQTKTKVKKVECVWANFDLGPMLRVLLAKQKNRIVEGRPLPEAA
jgi:site-specific DNA-adenine methylase